MVRRLPVLQNAATAPAPRLGSASAVVVLVVVAGLCWAVLLWAVARFGWWAIAGSCFAACAFAGAIIGSQLAKSGRLRVMALAAFGFTCVVALVALLGGSLSQPLLFVASFLAVGGLSAAGFFAGGWFLTLRR